MTQRLALAPVCDFKAPVVASSPRLRAVAKGAVLVHVVNPHAPRLGARYHGHCEGLTVSEAIAQAGWVIPWNTILVRGDQPVKRADWDTAIIGRDELVVLITQPLKGGSTSQTLAIVASIALALAAPQIGVALLGEQLAGTAIVAGVTYGSLATVGVVLAGQMLISALLPHPKPFQTSTNQSPTYSLGAQSNAARLLQSKPERFGLFRWLPDLASAPYFDFTASQQNLYQEFDLGMGWYRIDEVGVANNAIWRRDEAHPDGDYTGTYPEIELQFLNPGGTNTLFPNNVVTSSDVSNITLIGSNEPDYDWVGPFITNPSTTKASRLAIDIAFPAGLFKLNGSKLDNATASFSVEAQPIDDEGLPSGARTAIITPTITMATRDAVRTTFDATVAPGRFQVWIKRTNEKSEDANTSDTMVALAMRAFLPSQGTRASTTVVAMKARSTKNLSGDGAQKFYVIATRMLPIYNLVTGIWSEPVATRSISAAAAYICRAQNGLRKPDSKIDLRMLFGTLEPVWTARGDTFDGAFDTAGSAWSALQQVLRCGRAEPLRAGRFITFNRDQPKTVPRGGFDPLNMTAGSFNIDMTMQDASSLDALWIDYVDERNWQPASVFCALPGSTVSPNDAPRVQWLGIVKRDQAWREGMFLCAVNRYRRKFPNFSTEMDGRFFMRGDKTTVCHWLPGWGAAASVIALKRDAGGDILTLDQPWTAPNQFNTDQKLIALWTPDGRKYGPVRMELIDDGTDSGEAVVRLLETAGVLVGRYAGQQPRDWPQFNGGPQMDMPRATFGTATQKPLDALIVSMKPSGTTCGVATVIDDPRVHTADQGEPPAEVNPPGSPVGESLVINNILIGEVADGSGGTQLNIVIVGAPDAITFDIDTSWAEAPDMTSLLGQPRQSTQPSMEGTVVISARAVGASGGGPWFTPDMPFEATGVPQGDEISNDPPSGTVGEVSL